MRQLQAEFACALIACQFPSVWICTESAKVYACSTLCGSLHWQLVTVNQQRMSIWLYDRTMTYVDVFNGKSTRLRISINSPCSSATCIDVLNAPTYVHVAVRHTLTV